MVQKLVYLYNLYNGALRSPGQTPNPYPAWSSADQIGFIGDQLTDQNGNPGTTSIMSRLVTQGWGAGNVMIDALSGRTISNGSGVTTQNVIDSWRSLGFNPRTFCFALITNDDFDTDVNWTAKVNAVLDKVLEMPHQSGLKYRIFWIGGPAYRADIQAGAPYSTRYSRFQTVMDTIRASRVPSDFELISCINITAYIHNGRDETGLFLSAGSDATGRGMTTAGYTVRNDGSIPMLFPPSQNIFTEDGLPIFTEAGDPIYA